MAILSSAAREALNAGHLAHMVTLDLDGTPQVTVVWTAVDGDDIVTAHLMASKKVRNVQRDPRVAISLVTGGRNEIGLDNYLVVHGTARVHEGGAPELLQRMAEVYLGPGIPFPPMPDPPPGFVVRTTPTRVLGVGPWLE
jgi:PPOX class probable F420-dependent enzyme